MHTTDSAAEPPQPEPAAPVVPAAGSVPAADATPEAPPADDAAPEPVIEETTREVTLQRSVRYGRVLTVGAVLGAAVATLLSLVFPIEEGAEYTMGQVVGFMALIGGAIGLGAGGLLALFLGLAARRRRGSGVAIQTDVR